MKIKFYTNENGEKQYTLKDKIKDKPTEEAHYKFLKIKSIKESADSKESSER